MAWPPRGARRRGAISGPRGGARAGPAGAAHGCRAFSIWPQRGARRRGAFSGGHGGAPAPIVGGLRKPALCAEPEFQHVSVFIPKTNLMRRTGVSHYAHFWKENEPFAQNRSFNMSAFSLRKQALCTEPELQMISVVAMKASHMHRTGVSTYQRCCSENKPYTQNWIFQI